MIMLLTFLRTTPVVRESPWRILLGKSLEERLGFFYIGEIEESKKDISRLGQPPRPVDAELGILLHNQTKYGMAGSF